MEEANISYVAVDMFVRIVRRPKDPRERAVLVARRKDNGKEFVFVYQDINEEDQDLIVCDFKPNLV